MSAPINDLFRSARAAFIGTVLHSFHSKLSSDHRHTLTGGYDVEEDFTNREIKRIGSEYDKLDQPN